MAAKLQNLGKGYGTRYGRKLRVKAASITDMRRGSTKCPYCNYNGIKRLAVGIWECSKCSNKFSGKAYTFNRRLITAPQEAMLEEQAAVVAEAVEEVPKEEEEEKGQKVPDVIKEEPKEE